MPEAIKVAFATVGMAEVESAFATIAKRAQDLMRLQMGTARRASQATSKAANDNIKADEQAIKSAQRRQKYVDQVALNSAKLAGRIANQEVNERERAERAKQRAAESTAKYIESVRRNSMRAEQRYYEQQVRLAKQAQDKVAAEHRKADGLAGRKAGAGANLAGRAGRTAWGTLTGVAGGIAATAGTYAIGAGLSEAMDLQRKAALLSNAAAPKGMLGPDPGMLTKQAQGIATTTGLKATDVLESMSIVSARAGGAKGLAQYREDIEDLAKTAVAAGVSIQDMGSVVAAALKADVKPGKEMRQLMMDLVMIGKEGAVEFTQLASELPKLAGAGRETELTKGQLIRRQVGLAQVAVDQKVSAEEARTAVIDTIHDIGLKSETAKRNGINIYGKTGLQRDPAEVVADFVDRAFTKGITDKRGRVRKGADALFGGTEPIFSGTSKAVVLGALKEYQAKGGSRQAVVDMFNTAGGGTMDEAQRNREYGRVMDTSAQQLEVNLQKFNEKIGELLPRFTQLLPTITNLTEKFANLVVTVAENPWKAVFALLGLALVKEIAAAGIGAAVKAALVQVVKGVPGGAPLGAPVGGGGRFGQALAVAGAATIGAGVGLAVGEFHYGGAEGAGKKGAAASFDALVKGRSELAAVQHGEATMTEEGARKKAAYLQEMANFRQEQLNPSVMAQILSGGAANIEAKAGAGGASPKELNDLAAAYLKQAEQINKTTNAMAKLEVVVGNLEVVSPNSQSRNAPASRAGIR